jgi:hypothetical protein
MATRYEFLHVNEAGIAYYLRHEDDGSIHMDGFQDVQPMLDENHKMLTENNGWNADKTMRRAASIPMNLINQWKQTEGFDALKAVKEDPKALFRKLNDSNWLRLRTAHWNM